MGHLKRVAGKKMDSSEGDFALLLLAENQAAIYVKNRSTNKRTSKHTNVTKIIVL